MTRDIDVNLEPLPGYRLIERIGAGGYGEVWRAEAPGGLTKAIKFVFGQQHEKRAVNELRALDHVLSVRHPFLLSLERIEIVDGRLLVVTELADQSVKDRFDQCRREKKRGIPRDELLTYLRDAADALDFMSATHSLQHLDIKPENLLILSGHVKVADFGLVKDVRQSQASLVGGMTPLYAAPEVFRGTPSRQSDQYSLAIVYQEMLTGSLPFVGDSAAELTLHHLNDEPDIGMLTGPDRYAVSRALAKDSQHRYATCREFVDALIIGKQEIGSTETAEQQSDYYEHQRYVEQPVRESQPTEFFDDDQPADWHGGTAHILVDAPPINCELVDLPPLDLDNTDQRLIPTVILGVGGTGGRVLSQFRKKVADRCGQSKAVPALQFLQLDTDTKGVSDTPRNGAKGLSADELLNLPLRRPQHYRENSQQLLHWLSRRWLYNIPRSLKTEGLRPLGRLALADHARQAGQRIRRAMVQALEPAAIEESTAALGQAFRGDALRVVLVASISGGTGSGMSLDLGYAVRAILNKLDLPHAEIIGLMMHSTGRDARQSELGRVNAFSWLTEFDHFSHVGNSYPGDISCGFPPHAAGTPAFDHTYLLDLGTNLDALEFEQATYHVAEYIGLNTLSAANAFFRSARASQQKEEARDFTRHAGLRSFGLFRHTVVSNDLCDQLAQLVSERLLARWRSSTGNDEQDEMSREESQLVTRLQLDAAGLAANSRSMIDLHLGSSASDFVSAWLAERAKKRGANQDTLLAEIDRLFGREEPNSDAEFRGRRPADLVTTLADKLKSEFRRWIVRHIEKPGQRIAGARSALTIFEMYFRRVETDLKRIRSAAVDRLIQIRAEAAAAALASPSKSGCANLTLIDEYFHTGLDHLTILGAEHVLRVVVAEGKAICDELASLGREIEQIANALICSMNAISNDGDNTPASAQQMQRVAERFGSRLDDFALQVDDQLQAEFLDATGGLVKTISQGGRPRAQLTAKLQEVSRRVVHHQLSASAAQNGELGSPSPNSSLSGAIAQATPAVLEYGGRRRILAVMPMESSPAACSESTTQVFGKPVTAIHGVDSSLVVCVEADNLSLPHVALDIVERRRDRINFAGRVHSRTDVEWQPLINNDCTPNVWGEMSRHADAQQDLYRTMVM